MRVASAVALLMLGAVELQAQSLFVGVRAGQLSARQTSNDASFCSGDVCFAGLNHTTRARKTSAVSGLSATLELAPWIAFASDLQFVEKGMLNEFSRADMKLEYVEMPMMIRVANPVPNVSVRLFGEGGLAPAREVSCRGRQPFDGVTFLSINCGTWRDRKFDVASVLGGGLLLRQPAYQVSLSYRRTRGLRDLQGGHPEQRFNDTRAFLVSFVARLK